MHTRARELINALALDPHPEGGHYRRVHASALRVRPDDGDHDRPALTAIHFLLAAGEFSRWHCVDADESWHHAEGDALELFVVDPDARVLTRRCLGRYDAATKASPLVVVPAGHWQAARPLGAYTLVGCSVGPGFEFAGFTLLAQAPAAAAMIAAVAPELTSLAGTSVSAIRNGKRCQGTVFRLRLNRRPFRAGLFTPSLNSSPEPLRLARAV